MLGAREYFDYLQRNGLTVDESIRTRTFGNEKVDWPNFITTGNKDLSSMEAYDLLDRLLVYEPGDRITAKEALDHEYFNNK